MEYFLYRIKGRVERCKNFSSENKRGGSYAGGWSLTAYFQPLINKKNPLNCKKGKMSQLTQLYYITVFTTNSCIKCHGICGIIQLKFTMIKSTTASISYTPYTSYHLSTLPLRSSIDGVVEYNPHQSLLLARAQLYCPVHYVSSLRCLLTQYLS